MVTFSWKNFVVKAVVVLTLPLATTLLAEAVQAAAAKQQEPKRHKLAATLETTQWGWLDPNEAPKLTVDSGDIVSIETMMHSTTRSSRAPPWKTSSRCERPIRVEGRTL